MYACRKGTFNKQVVNNVLEHNTLFGCFPYCSRNDAPKDVSLKDVKYDT